jgi:hypothetical protein
MREGQGTKQRWMASESYAALESDPAATTPWTTMERSSVTGAPLSSHRRLRCHAGVGGRHEGHQAFTVRCGSTSS